MSQQITARKQQELQLQYSNYKNGLQQIAQKIGDVESEAEEHNRIGARQKVYLQALMTANEAARNSNLTAVLGSSAHRFYYLRIVLETLEPLPADRKCFRMINGVLVERTVKDVIPALKVNSEGLKQVLEDLVKQYNSKQTEMEKWKKKNNIQVVQQ